MVCWTFRNHTKRSTVSDSEIFNEAKFNLPPEYDIVEITVTTKRLFRKPIIEKQYSLYLFMDNVNAQVFLCVNNKAELLAYIYGYSAGCRYNKKCAYVPKGKE